MEDNKTTLSQHGYSDTSIGDNEGPKGLRERPATLLEDAGIAGCTQTVFEIIANSIDEARQGYGDKIDVIVEEDNTVTIRDYGRGVPMGLNSKVNKYNWELVFCTLYASGKGKGTAYSTSEGLNGVGCTAAQYTSDFMEVKVNRVNDAGQLTHYEMNFKDGYPVGKLSENPITSGQTGTEVRFKPSASVFMQTEIRFESYADRLRRKAMVVPGLTINLKYKDRDNEVFYFKDGIAEYLDNNTQDKLINRVLRIQLSRKCNDLLIHTGKYDANKDYIGESDIAITFVKDEGEIEVYHNGAILSMGGPSRDIIQDTCLKFFTQYGRDTGKLVKNEKFADRDIDGMIAACAETRCPGGFSEFVHQTKTAIRNPALISLIMDNLYTGLSEWAGTNVREADKILETMLINKKSREKEASFKAGELKRLKQDVKKIGNTPSKLLPAKSRDTSKTELFIIEGDSAKGAVSSSRDGEYQAVFPLRGKIPNSLKKALDVTIKKDIIIDLLAIIGCGVERRNKYMRDLPIYSEKKLNYDKIILATDADVDGGHIDCLLIIFFLAFCPSLIKQGHVYIAISPLYIITAPGLKGRMYGYDESDRDRIVNALKAEGIPESKINIQRSKGLGENSEEVMFETVLNPSTRRLAQLQYPENDSPMWELCDQLLGNDIESRRTIIKEYFNTVKAIED